jgi:WD40 repeat protein/predicted Ser/Thr protein kinase
MSPAAGVERCPDCGNQYQADPSVGGLCPNCLLSLAVRTPDETPDAAQTLPPLATGRILGERYQIRELLGRGGMGVVFRAFDLKLRVDVALKSVRPDRVDEKSHELQRQEVRAAREVVSSNVCRIFDLVVEDGQEFVSMEYIEGATLAEAMRAKGPLALKDAREIASQFLAGLEAIHAAGLVHRDFKPENVMITRAGRVVVMDFGLARARTTGPSETVSGTPAYMAPEQMRAEGIDSRADVFAAAIVLAEMLSVGGESIVEQRQALWRAVRETPPRLADTPWAPALRQALSANAADRHATARVLARAIEEVTLRMPGVDERRPYPGLSSFTTADAEYFFGREPDIEAVLQKLKRPRMLSLVGPSGAGKTSFLRAGLLPRLPPIWGAIIATPGHRPFQALAQAIAPLLAGDAEAVQQLLRFDDMDTAVGVFRRFRGRHAHALVVLDQFEELFTLTTPETQGAFASLLGRLVLEADCHVVLSLRDDFLLRCNAHEALAPAFSDLTPLGALSESALRRALTQPALACGYQFEDESLVDDMVAAVSNERGALPLLAFAASRLWEQRDRERGLLTRRAYEEIGGVGGALAQHAEATLGRIGTRREPVVRELFRNLITVHGTRAVRDRDELLSVFPVTRAEGEATRAEAGEVLDALIAARLLTAYEESTEFGGGGQQVEIVHESMLQAWPRLVRWQTQDADGEQLRHQLRQSAQLWHDRGRSEDLLWSGAAYRDFTVWRERYSGGLTSTEEAFAQAATRRNGRRRLRRRIAMAGALAVAMLVAFSALGLWRRAEQARQHAEAERLRAEAGKLLALAEGDVDRHPTGALAFALKSLELTDTSVGRLLALRVLQQSPIARVARIEGNSDALYRTFSPDGAWLAMSGFDRVSLMGRTGGEPRVLVQYPSRGVRFGGVGFNSGGDAVATEMKGDVRLWSVVDGRELRRVRLEYDHSHMTDHGIFTEVVRSTPAGLMATLGLWPFADGQAKSLGTMPELVEDDVVSTGLAFIRGRRVYLRPFDQWTMPPRLVVELPAEARQVALTGDGSKLVASDASGKIEAWSTRPTAKGAEWEWQAPGPVQIGPDWTGKRLLVQSAVEGKPSTEVFDLTEPAGTLPRELFYAGEQNLGRPAVDPSGSWVSTRVGDEMQVWWVGGPWPRVVTSTGACCFSFTPDGRWIVMVDGDRGLLQALPMMPGDRPRTLKGTTSNWRNVVAVAPSGRQAAVGLTRGQLQIVDLQTGQSQPLEGFPPGTAIGEVAFSPDGHLLAATPGIGPRAEKVVRVFNLDDRSVRVFGPLPGTKEGLAGSVRSLAFAGANRLVALVEGAGLVLVDLQSGALRLLADGPNRRYRLGPDGVSGVGLQSSPDGSGTSVVRFGLDGGPVAVLTSYENPTEIALDPSGTALATGGDDGVVRVGRLAGGEPHVLFGHRHSISSLMFSPDGRWLAAASGNSIRIWRVPDVSRTPLHKLPLVELLTRLRALTNLRAVEDGSAIGYALKPGPFPGWAMPPPE